MRKKLLSALIAAALAASAPCYAQEQDNPPAKEAETATSGAPSDTASVSSDAATSETNPATDSGAGTSGQQPALSRPDSPEGAGATGSTADSDATGTGSTAKPRAEVETKGNGRGANYNPTATSEAEIRAMSPTQIAARNSAIRLYNKGIGALTNNDARSALELFTQAIKADPKFLASYENRALAYDKLGNHKAALEDANYVLKTAPERLENLNKTARAKERLGDFKGALADMDRLVEAYPDRMMYLHNRLLVKMRSNDYKGAGEDVEKALKLAPGNADLLKLKKEIAERTPLAGIYLELKSRSQVAGSKGNRPVAQKTTMPALKPFKKNK